MIRPIVQGQPLAVDAEFLALGVPTDPVVVRCFVRRPSGVLSELTYPSPELTRVDVGWYVAQVVADEAGTWGFRFTSAGAVEAVGEVVVNVARSVVLS